MSLQHELKGILVENLQNDPAWAGMIERIERREPDATKVVLSGPIDETLPVTVDALMTYSDALLAMIMRLAEVVDDLRDGGSAKVEKDGG